MKDGEIAQKELREVYEEMKTPVKQGMIMREEGVVIDSPNIFRKNDGTFAMTYVRFMENAENPGYETWIAESADLLHWKTVGKLLPRKGFGWDALQAGGNICLVDSAWEGDHSVHAHKGKYWMSYLGGCLSGYEPDPLRIGMAYGETIAPGSFTRLPEPILSNEDEDARPFEMTTLYKSNVVYDREETLGYPYVMYYNAKAGRFQIEKIGMAVSGDMVHWKRYGKEAVLSNGIEDRWNIAGDPQVVKYRNLWVMHYFVAMDGTAYDTFACSEDMVHWTKWEGEPLVKPSEGYDRKFAHKPCVLKHEGVVYHFYCAVGDLGRGIALATSREISKGDERDGR